MSIKSRLVLLALTFVLSNVVLAEVMLKPFVLAETIKVDMSTVVGRTKQNLSSAGFEIVGEVSPYANTTILVVTNDSLKQNAAASDFGAFGAMQRVTITQVKNEVQVAFTNPVYMAQVYRMKSDLADVASALKKALGDQGEYGPEEGLTKEDLRDYHYKWLMPYFYDRLELAEYTSYQEAIAGVEKALAANKGGVSKVYRIDIPSKQATVFGVRLRGPEDNDCSGDKYIMDRIDFKAVKSSGHLPYEMVVSKNKVYALPAEFRIAISFPDLSMMGSNSFASIMCAPSAIEDALTVAAGGKVSDDY